MLCSMTRPLHNTFRKLIQHTLLRALSRLTKHRHLCALPNQAPLTHHSRCSYSTQAPSLSSSDEPIMPVFDQMFCFLFLSTLVGDTRMPSFGPRGAETGTFRHADCTRQFVKVQLGKSQVERLTSSGKAASGGKVGRVYLCGCPLLLR